MSALFVFVCVQRTLINKANEQKEKIDTLAGELVTDPTQCVFDRFMRIF